MEGGPSDLDSTWEWEATVVPVCSMLLAGAPCNLGVLPN